jgi:hypothetical protein
MPTLGGIIEPHAQSELDVNASQRCPSGRGRCLGPTLLLRAQALLPSALRQLGTGLGENGPLGGQGGPYFDAPGN